MESKKETCIECGHDLVSCDFSSINKRSWYCCNKSCEKIGIYQSHQKLTPEVNV